MVKQLFEQSLFLFGYLLVLVHVHLMIHLSPCSHAVVNLFVTVVHSERVGLRIRPTGSSDILLGMDKSVKLGVVRRSYRLPGSVHHFFVGMDIL